MKLRAVNFAILAFGLSLPLTTIAGQTESQTSNALSQNIDLSQPNQSDSAILAWANSTAVATFTYNYVNYRESIQNLSGFFTDSGWKEFMSALDKSKTDK